MDSDRRVCGRTASMNVRCRDWQRALLVARTLPTIIYYTGPPAHRPRARALPFFDDRKGVFHEL